MKTINYKFICLLFLLAFLPLNFVSAAIIFNEVMYNPSGTDTGREWLEIYNTGPDSVDITTLKLFENSVNHKITAYSGINSITIGQYAIIVDNPEKFLADFNFSGIIFDSAFSLNNTGEEIKLLNSGGEEIDTLIYSLELGGNDTGNSLQLNDLGWIPAGPTPGTINAAEAVNENSGDESETENSNSGSEDSSDTTTETGSGSVHEEQTDITNYKPTLKLKVSAGRERFVSTNGEFELVAVHNQEKNSRIRAKWSMGNGHEIRGRKVTYKYDRAGEYEVVLTANLGEDEAISRTKIHVSDPNIKYALSDSGKGVDLLLKNFGGKELNISGYRVENKGRDYVFARDTIIGSGRTLTLSENTTGLAHNSEIVVYFPNGDKLETF